MTMAVKEAPSLVDFKREIRRLHGCASEFVRFVTVPEVPGRGRRVVAVFGLSGHVAHRCYVWLEPADGGTELVAVLHGVEIRSPEDAVRHVTQLERVARERWAQEYA